MKELRLSRGEVERLVAEATPGPWNLGYRSADDADTNIAFVNAGTSVICKCDRGTPVRSKRFENAIANASFIASTPDLAHDLLTLHDRLREAERALKLARLYIADEMIADAVVLPIEEGRTLLQVIDASLKDSTL